MTANELHDDFELVHSPWAPESPPDPNPHTASTPLPSTAPNQPTEPRPSIQSLFNNFNETTQPTPAQYLAKVLVLSTLPFVLAWTTITTLASLEYLALKNQRPISDDKVLEQISAFVKEDVEKCQARLRWVDEEVGQEVERYQARLAASKVRIEAATDDMRQYIRDTDLRCVVHGAKSIMFFLVGITIMAFGLFNCFRLPLWLAVAFGYWLKGRRMKRKVIFSVGEGRTQFRRRY